MKATSGMTKPSGPLASTAHPRAAPQAQALRHELQPGPRRPSVGRWPVTKHHNPRVVKKTSGASGVADRPPTAVQTQVAMANPASSPAWAPKPILPIRQTSRQVRVVRMAEPRRAPVSLRPATAKPARWTQLTSAGFSTRRRPLNVGTTQSPRSSIASEQAAFFGSSSSQSAGPPRFVRRTSAAAAATTAACRRGGITAGHLPGGASEQDRGSWRSRGERTVGGATRRVKPSGPPPTGPQTAPVWRRSASG